MIVPDLNVLIYATDDASSFHSNAREHLDAAMSGTETVGLAPAVSIGFVRIVTNPRIMHAPLAAGAAIDIVETWLGRRNVSALHPSSRHYEILRELLDGTGVGGNLVSDAHLAALAIENSATLWSYDSDFARFPGLRWQDPRG